MAFNKFGKFGNEFGKKAIDVNLKIRTTVIATCTIVNMIINFTKFIPSPAPLI